MYRDQVKKIQRRASCDMSREMNWPVLLKAKGLPLW